MIVINAFFVRADPNNIIRIFVKGINRIMRQAAALLRIMHQVFHRSLLLMNDIDPAMVGAGPNLAPPMLNYSFYQCVIQPERMALLINIRDMASLPVNVDQAKSIFRTV